MIWKFACAAAAALIVAGCGDAAPDTASYEASAAAEADLPPTPGSLTPEAAPGSPVALVRQIYVDRDYWDPDGAWKRYYAADLADALEADKSDPDLAPNVNFDHRYDAQDGGIANLRFESLDRAPGLVAASFDREGEPDVVVWTLIQCADGRWRVADAESRDGDHSWSLRELLDLPPGPDSC